MNNIYNTLIFTALVTSVNAQVVTNGSMDGTPGPSTAPSGWSATGTGYNGGLGPTPDLASVSSTWDAGASSSSFQEGITRVDSTNSGTWSNIGAYTYSGTTEGILTTITGLTQGQTYSLTFEFANFGSSGVFGPTTVNWMNDFGVDVTIGTQSSQTQTIALASKWHSYTTQFTASGTTAEIKLLARDGGGDGRGSYGSVDGFSVTAVPEPSSTALLGLGALGLLVRRKR